MNNQNYRVATKEECAAIVAQAKEWLETSPAGMMFNDCKSATKSSVAEFIANQQGLTVYQNVPDVFTAESDDDLARAEIKFEIFDMLNNFIRKILPPKIDRLLEEQSVLKEHDKEGRSLAVPKDIIVAIAQYLSEQYDRPSPSRSTRAKVKRYFLNIAQW